MGKRAIETEPEVGRVRPWRRGIRRGGINVDQHMVGLEPQVGHRRVPAQRRQRFPDVRLCRAVRVRGFGVPAATGGDHGKHRGDEQGGHAARAAGSDGVHFSSRTATGPRGREHVALYVFGGVGRIRHNCTFTTYMGTPEWV